MSQKPYVKVIQLLNQQTNQLEPYILSLNLLGQGQFGTVYKAIHKFDKNKIFAVKSIRLTDPKAKQQTLKQLRIIQHLPLCPNIIKIQKHQIQSQNNLYIFQQYCQSGSLQRSRQQRKIFSLTQRQIFDLFYQLSHGYISLYNSGIIHQDIKPANIMKAGKLYKYCDFGVSQLLAHVKKSKSRNGTMSYMAPEKLNMDYLPNAKSDIYSLGVTLYEVIFGTHPYGIQGNLKDYKIYLKLLNSAKLRPTHQLIDKVRNTSVIFEKFIYFLQKMINLKPQNRVSIQQLQNFITTQQPFKNMTIPTNQYKNKFSQQQFPQQLLLSANYQILQKSKICVIKSNKKNQSKQKQKNEQINLFVKKIKPNNKKEQKEQKNVQYEIKRQQNKEINKQMRLKQGEELKSKLKQRLNKAHRIIQSLTNYLSLGVKNFTQCFNQISSHNLSCGNTFFHNLIQNPATTQYTSFCLNFQPVPIIFHLLILKLNSLLMSSTKHYFLSQIQSLSSLLPLQLLQSFSYQSQFQPDITYLQSQFNIFISQQNFDNQNNKRSLVIEMRQWNISKFIEILIKEISQMFVHTAEFNQIRVEYKNDILNAIFLLEAEYVLIKVKQLDQIIFNGVDSRNKERLAKFDQLLEQIYTQIKIFNQIKIMKKQQLKIKLNQYVKKHQKQLLFSFEDNQDEFQDFDQLIKQLDLQGEIQMIERQS